MFEHAQGRKDFIANAVARAITSLRGATVQEHQNAVASAQTLANMLELDGLAPWPRETYAQIPRVEQTAVQAAALAAQQGHLVQPPIQAAPVPTGNPNAVDNAARLMAAIGGGQPAPQPLAAPPGPSVGTGQVVGGEGVPRQGTASNPATSGAVIAAHGEVQGQREVVVGPTVTPSGIVSDVQAVRTPGTVP